IDYPADTGLSNIPDQEVQQALGVDLATVKQLKDKPELRDYRDDQSLPAELRSVRLPQSTYAEYARLRPGKVRNGYTKDQANIDEYIGPYVVTQYRIWFGKAFYDEEGQAGVGDIGYFDRATRKYTFLQIPELRNWSVSTLLFEGQTIWAGLLDYPE